MDNIKRLCSRPSDDRSRSKILVGRSLKITDLSCSRSL
jgi:hypothetical protein